VPFSLANVDGRAALVDQGRYFDLEKLSGGSISAHPRAALADPGALHELAGTLGAAEPTGLLAGATLGPPVPDPRNCYGIGLNYRDHAAESGMDLPENPVVFTKFPSCLNGPAGDIEMRSDGVDYEGELVVVIGPGGKDITVAGAWDHVVGLTAGQDVSDRPAQMMARPPQFALGKSFDTFGPIGPVIVSTDSFDDPSDLGLQTFVNDDKRQDARTSSLIFDVPTLVSFISSITTLQTGDLIYTGTPQGVGAPSRNFLTDGDVVTTTIEGIGTMTNRCVRVSDWRR
jgi:2-keto-4-pentenoate hydratase/2-oxohepta-3-ene-1,7-dioic acid hydratase in catechol pathway